MIHLARTPQVLQLPVLLLSMQLFFGVLKVLPLRHLRVLIHPPCWSPAPLSTHGLHNTSQHLWLFEPSTFNKWLKELPISEPKRKVLNDNFAKMEEWWAKQPADALDTIERVAATMGIPVNLMGKNYEALNLLRTMTAGISLTN